MTPWLDAKTYYTRRWGQAVGRVGVDGGFSCPNRGINRTQPGCAFCSEEGNRPPYQTGTSDLEEQVHRGIAFQTERYGFTLFSLYFQSYSSTWAPVDQLRRLYDRGLSLGPFVDLTVGTRPDCFPEPVADLLASYQSPEREVWVELGLQSARDSTLARINRGHGVQAFRDAAACCRDRGLRFTAHILYGLPGEDGADFSDSVALALQEGAAGLKLHDLLIVPGTALYRDWQAGLLSPVDPQEYLVAAADSLARVPAEVVVWRVCSDPENRKELQSPGEKWSKNRFLDRLKAEVLKRRTV